MQLPIFPLGSVLFPGGRLPLRIFEPRYVEMIGACIRDHAVFGVSLIRAGYEVGKPAIPCELGCTARILHWQRPEADRYELVAQGESVFRILERTVTPAGLVIGQVEIHEPPDPTPVPARLDRLRGLLATLIEELGEAQFPSPRRLDDAAWLGYRLCELLPVTPERKQALLEIREPLALLDELERIMKQLAQEEDGG